VAVFFRLFDAYFPAVVAESRIEPRQFGSSNRESQGERVIVSDGFADWSIVENEILSDYGAF
jgi:hypothetical protein